MPCRVARVGAPLSGVALRRSTAARGAGACVGPIAWTVAIGRAALCARRTGARQPARGGQGASAASRRYGDYGLPRPGRGVDHGRPHCRDGSRAPCSDRDAVGDLSTSRYPFCCRLCGVDEFFAQPGEQRGHWRLSDRPLFPARAWMAKSPCTRQRGDAGRAAGGAAH